MGILDGLLGGTLGGMPGTGDAGQAPSPLLRIALQLLQQNGGVNGVLERFRQGGYSGEADSWQGTGQNMPLSASALQEVLGSGAVGRIAGQLGMSQGEAAGGLAQLLPQLVDQFTPDGRVPDDHDDVVARALALLTRTKPG
jgi:uncharacterized protein YidB (DUF937 family)